MSTGWLAKRIAAALLFLSSISAGSEAMACAFAPTPFDPEMIPSDAIIIATVGKAIVDRVHGDTYTFRLQKWLLGTERPERLTAFESGPCGAWGPQLHQGERAILYVYQFANGSFVIRTWRKIGNALPSAEDVKAKNDLALHRDRRRTQFFVIKDAAGYGYNVALSINDPKTWLSDADYPANFFSASQPKLIVLTFSVADDGTMTDCVLRQGAGFAQFEAGLCDLLAQRARLAPPVFPEEKSGYFLISTFRPIAQR